MVSAVCTVYFQQIKSINRICILLVCDKLPEVMHIGPGLLVCAFLVASRILSNLSFTSRQSGLTPGTRRLTFTSRSVLVGRRTAGSLM